MQAARNRSGEHSWTRRSNLFSGTGSQTGTSNRWGDYSELTVDPVDDCTFWYTTEYYQPPSQFNWRTRIGSFKFRDAVARYRHRRQHQPQRRHRRQLRPNADTNSDPPTQLRHRLRHRHQLRRRRLLRRQHHRQMPQAIWPGLPHHRRK